MNKPLIISDKNKKSLYIKKKVNKILSRQKLLRSNVVIVIGGDGFMLQTLKKSKNTKKSFYGIKKFWKLWFSYEQINFQKKI